MRRRRGPRQLSEAVAGLRRSAAPPTLLAEVQQCWSAAVGEQVSREAEPVAERAGVVAVSCRSSVWAAELRMLTPGLLERLNTALGGPPRVQALEFTTRPSD